LSSPFDSGCRMKAIICSLLSMLVISGFSAYEGWSDPILIADGETYTHYDKPHIALDLDGNYVVVHRFWNGQDDCYFTKIDQAGNVLVGPKPIAQTAYMEDFPVCIVLSDNTVHMFYIVTESSIRNIYYVHLDEDGDILEGPSLFVETFCDTRSAIAITKEPDDTIHIAYKDKHGSAFLLGYTRWNPITDDRLDVWEIEVTNPHVYNQGLDDNWDIAVDSEGNAHLFFDQVLYFDWMNPVIVEVCWAKVPYDSEGEYESKIISRFYDDNFNDGEPSGTVDDDDIIHMVWSGRLNYRDGGLYYSMDNDGNEITGYKHILPDPFAGETGRLRVRYNNGELAVMGVYYNSRYIYGRLDLSGDVIQDFDYITDEETVWDDNLYPAYIHHNNGFINLVWSTDHDLWYQYTLDGFAADESGLKAFPNDEGILLSWREEGELIGSTWHLERDGERLVNLSGDALYRYLDRDAEPNITHLYTLEATLPDGSTRRYGPVEATWSGPDADRLTLYTPYPCPATDRVTFSYSLPEDTKNAELSLYDLSGRLVASSVSVPTAPGRHEIGYDTSNLPPGVYVARLSTDDGTFTRRVVVSR
jgi:hypothetical protein